MELANSITETKECLSDIDKWRQDQASLLILKV